MDTSYSSTAVTVTRIAERHWHAIHDDRTVGRAEVFHRPDGRSFLSIDAWHADVFDQLARAMTAALRRPLYTIVDEADVLSTSQWQWAGFSVLRREWEYVLPTTGCSVSAGFLPPGTADVVRLRELDRALRAELDWAEVPPEILPGGTSLVDPSRYAVVVEAGEYAGLARVVPIPRQPRIGLVAVRSGLLRRGIGRALVNGVQTWAREFGAATVAADVKETNSAAIALFESCGGRRGSSSLELVLR